MSLIEKVDNITSPGADLSDGDMIRITYTNGHTVERTFTEAVVDISPPPIRLITVGAFLDRLNVDGKMNVCYQMADAGKLLDPPDYTLYTALKNLERRTYIDLDNPIILPTIKQIGIHTDDELVAIFADGTTEESIDIGGIS